MENLKNVIGDYQRFLDEIFFLIDDIDLAVDHLELDHLCYRVESIEAYRLKKNELNAFGTLLIESYVNGRNISTFKLNTPIEYKNRKIYLIELPEPKKSHAYKEGLEHVEFVTKEPLVKVVARYPQFAFETFGIHKKVNADITLKLGDYCIRFHNHSLEDVILQELKESNRHERSRHHKK